MPMQCPKTRRHFFEHVRKLVGGVVPNTPPGRPEVEHFTSVDGHRSNISGRDCTCLEITLGFLQNLSEYKALRASHEAAQKGLKASNKATQKKKKTQIVNDALASLQVVL